MRIRPALASDWAAIHPIFAAIVADGETYAYPERLTEAAARVEWMLPPPTRVVVLEEAGRVLGSARMGPNRPGRGDHVATASFMVAAAARGQGVGRRLGEEMIAWARSAGFLAVQFNAVVETNSGAVHLWQSLGFRILTTVPQAFDHAEHGFVGLNIMYLPLTA